MVKIQKAIFNRQSKTEPRARVRVRAATKAVEPRTMLKTDKLYQYNKKVPAKYTNSQSHNNPKYHISYISDTRKIKPAKRQLVRACSYHSQKFTPHKSQHKPKELNGAKITHTKRCQKKAREVFHTSENSVLVKINQQNQKTNKNHQSLASAREK
jgi:hypothetical protein